MTQIQTMRNLFKKTLATAVAIAASATAFAELKVEQITQGPNHHFFGYIGHVQNIPWNGDDRYIVALRSTFQDHLPGKGEPADVLLIDTENNYEIEVVDQSLGWNPQQGTMFYWNPDFPVTQFFFNDRDPESGKIFTVLYDIKKRKRVKEFRFRDNPVGNSGVKQTGGAFAAINYARMARLRPVTGYNDAHDWTIGVNHPKDDGIFIVDSRTGTQSLLVSFEQMAAEIRKTEPHIDELELFINHTLWNRDGDRIFFFARAGWRSSRNKGKHPRINAPFVINPDGTGLKRLKHFFGGHPEWDYGHRMIGAMDTRQVIYDVNRELVVGQIGDNAIFPNPEGDIALSPQGDWFVNGHKDKEQKMNFYNFYRRSDGELIRSQGFDIGQWISGDLRQDPSPAWNRSGTKILVPGLVGDTNPTRQLFIISLPENSTQSDR